MAERTRSLADCLFVFHWVGVEDVIVWTPAVRIERLAAAQRTQHAPG